MRKQHLPLLFTALVILISFALIIGLVALPAPVSAQQAPPPPDKPPVDPPTEEPTDPPTEEPTAEPTDPPTEEPTEEPTDPPTEEPTDPPTEEPPTAEPPTEEPPATDEPAEKPATNQPKSGTSKENPFCKSLLTGTVYGDDGAPTTGATAILTGNGDDRSMMTDDKGQFGFGGLCPGSVTVVATLPGGQPTSPETLELDGKNPYYLELGSHTQAAAADAGEDSPAGAAAAEASTESGADVVDTALPEVAGAAVEPSMPTTGSNWLLLTSAALLGALLLVVGARLAFGSRS